MKTAAVLGASGYTGAEAVRLILGHPKLRLGALTAHSRAGEDYHDVYPNFIGYDVPDLVKADQVDWSQIDVVFACLPHGASQEEIAKIYDKVETVIDLSADFRLSDPNLYEKTYGRAHDFKELLASRIYGLSEFSKADLVGAKLVACPGCYPTASLLALLPGLKAGLIDPDQLIVDAKSGVTGAGRKATMAFSYSEITDGAQPYAIGTHRHAPEIDQGFGLFADVSASVRFTPHLVPMNRGMIATCHVNLTSGATLDDLRAAYVAQYADAAFVHVLSEGKIPQTRYIRGSNHCQIGLAGERGAGERGAGERGAGERGAGERGSGRAVIVSVIDNLTKGSSGQALQNYNLTQGWDETLGLGGAGLFP